MKRLAMAGLATLLLAGCGSTETASFLLAGAEVAITLERTKAYAWSDGWELNLVVRNNPECQRLHRLKDAADGGFKMEVYAAGERGVFILRQNKRWYVTDVKTCDLQQYKEAPPEPGKLVGSFQNRKDAFAYVPEKPAGDEAPDAGRAGG